MAEDLLKKNEAVASNFAFADEDLNTGSRPGLS